MRPRGGRRTVLAIALGAVVVLIGGAPLAAQTAAGEPLPVGRPPVSSLGEARFPHALHAEELGFECSDCHHETDATQLRMPHEEYFDDFWIECGICHRESGSPTAPRGCDDCHHASPSNPADETLSAKVVIHQSCWGCHDSGTGEQAARSCGFCHAGRRAASEEER